MRWAGVAVDPALVRPVEEVDGVSVIDVGMFGEARFGGVYLVEDEENALIETGTSNDYRNVLAALQALEVDPASIAHVLVTHIHLDHAGGAGFLLDHLPHATVYVHERGLPHLAHPERLLESASRALGKAFEGYGTLKPIPEARMVALRGGEVVDLGGRELEAVATPGHARHHLAILDRASRAVFTGDAAGIYFPGDRRLVPTTPFPEFDLPDALQAMETLARLNPRLLLYTHFGPRRDALRALRDQRAEYRRWDRRARELQATATLEQATASLYEAWYADVEEFPRAFVERTIATNLRGFYRYYERTGTDAA